MDTETDDLRALINAHNELLQALYIREFKTSKPTLRVVEQEISTRLQQAAKQSDTALNEGVDIYTRTEHEIWKFFRKVDTKIPE